MIWWYDKEFVDLNPKHTTQRCSDCGHIGTVKIKMSDNSCLVKEKANIGVKELLCPACNILHDRDVNATRNILDNVLNRWTFGNSSLNPPHISEV